MWNRQNSVQDRPEIEVDRLDSEYTVPDWTVKRTSWKIKRAGWTVQRADWTVKKTG